MIAADSADHLSLTGTILSSNGGKLLSPSDWARTRGLPDSAVLDDMKRMIEYENDQIHGSNSVLNWFNDVRVNGAVGFMQIGAGLGGAMGWDAAGEFGRDSVEPLAQATEGRPDANFITGTLPRNAAPIFFQILVTRGAGLAAEGVAGAAGLAEGSAAALRVAQSARNLAAIVQPALMTVGNTYNARLAAGDSEEDARRYAFAAGTNAAIITSLFGTGKWGGIESVAAGRLEQVTVGDLLKIATREGVKDLATSPELRRFATGILQQGLGQATEQGITTLTQTLLTADPTTDLGHAWDQSLQAAAEAMGTTLATHAVTGAFSNHDGAEQMRDGRGRTQFEMGDPKPNPRVTEKTPVPAMVRPLDVSPASGEHAASHGTEGAANPAASRDPGALRESLRRGLQAEAAAATDDQSGGTRTDVQKRRKYGRGLTSPADALAWAEKNGRILNPDLIEKSRTEWDAGGGEHTVIQDSESGRVVKLTKPGFFGAQGEDFAAYLDRWDKHNRAFDDHVAFEGFVTLPGENAPRAVISQETIKGRDATPEELADHLNTKGFHEVEPDRWIHPTRGLIAWDTQTPDNAIRAEDGSVHPIDLQVATAPKDELTALQQRTGIGRETAFEQGGGEPFADHDLSAPAPDLPRRHVPFSEAEQQKHLTTIGGKVAQDLGRPELATAFRPATAAEKHRAGAMIRLSEGLAGLFNKGVIVYSPSKTGPWVSCTRIIPISSSSAPTTRGPTSSPPAMSSGTTSRTIIRISPPASATSSIRSSPVTRSSRAANRTMIPPSTAPNSSGTSSATTWAARSSGTASPKSSPASSGTPPES